MNSGELDNARHAGFMEAVREMKNFVNCEQARLKGESEGFWSGAILGVLTGVSLTLTILAVLS